MPGQAVRYPTSHEFDLDAERADARYDAALQRLTVSDVLATVDGLLSAEPDERKHPLYHLARHALRFGTYRTSGKRAHLAEQLGAVYEDLIEAAIERLVGEELANFGPWED
jgi:hypothetical protein